MKFTRKGEVVWTERIPAMFEIEIPDMVDFRKQDRVNCRVITKYGEWSFSFVDVIGVPVMADSVVSLNFDNDVKKFVFYTALGYRGVIAKITPVENGRKYEEEAE